MSVYSLGNMSGPRQSLTRGDTSLTIQRDNVINSIRHPELPLYDIWSNMVRKCDVYKAFNIEPMWSKSFSTFLQDLGPRISSKHVVIRTDLTKGYTKDNCKWGQPKRIGSRR